MFQKMREIESRGILQKIPATKTSDRKEEIATGELEKAANLNILYLFLIVILGIFASWIWEEAWIYIKTKELNIEMGMVIARLIVSFIAAGLSFNTIYTKVNQNSTESWTPYVLAFQNGFFWDAIIKNVTATYQS